MIADADVDVAARRVARRFDVDPYDLGAGPLLRAALVCDGPRAVVVIGLHHAVGDGWSLAVLMDDLADAYRARLAGRASGRLPPPTTPRRLAAEEAALLAGPEGATRQAFWRGRLAGHPSIARAGSVTRFRGAGVARRVDAHRQAAWTAWAAARGETLAGALLAALHLALARVEGAVDALVCAHLHDRPAEERRRVIGYLVNVIPLRTDLWGVEDLDEVLPRVRRSWVEAVAHELPVDALVRALAPDRYATRFMPAPLAFNFIPVGFAPLPGPEASFRPAPELTPVPSFQFFERMIVARPDGDGLSIGAWVEEEALAATEVLLDAAIAALDEAARRLRGAGAPVERVVQQPG